MSHTTEGSLSQNCKGGGGSRKKVDVHELEIGRGLGVVVERGSHLVVYHIHKQSRAGVVARKAGASVVLVR